VFAVPNPWGTYSAHPYPLAAFAASKTFRHCTSDSGFHSVGPNKILTV